MLSEFMGFHTLISVSDLFEHLNDPEWAIVDCRFSLKDSLYGRKEYLKAHIPGAIYAHLDEDLCGPIIRGKTGRHPLPQIADIVQKFSDWGIDENVQVVSYDDAGGSMAAARLWWLLQWLGHTHVAVLDGGWQAWLRAGHLTCSGEEQRMARVFHPNTKPEILATVELVEQAMNNPHYLIIDSRTRDRYLGENEPIDPIAGHIPSAICIPYTENTDKDGFFLPADALRVCFEGISPQQTIFYCGSGVTAAQNVLAMVHSGLGFPKLYAGSWSEWITDPNHPIATG